MNTYIAFFNGRQLELQADSMYAAVLTARKELKVSKSKEGLLAVVLAAKGDEAVDHSGASL